MITTHPWGDVTVEFDGRIAIGGAKRGKMFCITLQGILKRKQLGEPVTERDLCEEEVTLAFHKPESIQILINQLTALKSIMKERINAKSSPPA